MKTWKRVSLIVGVLGLLAAATAAIAGPGRGRRFMNHMITARIEEALDEIDATPEQRRVVNEAKDAILAKLSARAKEHAQARANLVAVLAADRLDTNALYQEADRRAEEIRTLARELVPEIQKVHDVLTPEQRQKLAAEAKERLGRKRGYDHD